MQEQDRQGVRAFAALVHEMKPETVYLRPKLREPVEFGLLFAPVEPVAPVVGQLLEVAQAGAVVPTRVLDLLRPAGAAQSLLTDLSSDI